METDGKRQMERQRGMMGEGLEVWKGDRGRETHRRQRERWKRQVKTERQVERDKLTAMMSSDEVWEGETDGNAQAERKIENK